MEYELGLRLEEIRQVNYQILEDLKILKKAAGVTEKELKSGKHGIS